MTSSRASLGRASLGRWVCGRWGGGCRQACQADEGGADRRLGEHGNFKFKKKLAQISFKKVLQSVSSSALFFSFVMVTVPRESKFLRSAEPPKLSRRLR